MNHPFPNTRVGILGGGQLGKMLAIAAAPWHVPIWILDASEEMAAVPYCSHFVKGSFKNYEDVLAFGRQVDVLTVEIEHVNTDALIKLQEEGKTVHPDPRILRVIQDKGLQKQFYEANGLPTSSFALFDDKEDIRQAIQEERIRYPFVQKTRTAGYDGRGVTIIKSEDDELLDGASLIEPEVDIAQEIAVIVAANSRGEVAAYPPVEMVFDEKANLLDMLVSPARIPEMLQREAMLLAKEVMLAFGINGLLAVEMFVTYEGKLLINEVAPRPHNSGHHTIEANICSQYEQHLRAVLNWPLGSTQPLQSAIMINLLGAAAHEGSPVYQNVLRCMNIEGLHIHLYGKAQTRPFRKMGHVTLTGNDMSKLLKRAELVKQRIQVISES